MKEHFNKNLKHKEIKDFIQVHCIPKSDHNVSYLSLCKVLYRFHIHVYIYTLIFHIIYQANIKEVQQTSMQLPKTNSTVFVAQNTSRPAHNYSIQTFNSNKEAWELLRKEMAKVLKDQTITLCFSL